MSFSVTLGILFLAFAIYWVVTMLSAGVPVAA